MSGLYLHIPFCKQACHYCNFHFSTSLRQKEKMVQAICKEIRLQQGYLIDKTLTTVYLGGGTPSLLNLEELTTIFKTIADHFEIAIDAEITLEANPDDLTPAKLEQLASSPINRLSIGIQSFFDEDLIWMNRAHSAREAQQCIELAQNVGFQNLTIDLIYGTPTTNNEQWLANIQTAIEWQIPHISCYALTVEPNTALAHFIKKGVKANVDEQKATEQLTLLIEKMETNGYEHYEISNFSKPNCHARHNSNYWLGVPYLGIGPAAHSYDGTSRQWNVANNAKYIRAIEQNKLPFEKEILTPAQQYNEYILTALRTKWGCELSKITQWGVQYEKHFLQSINEHLNNGTVHEKNAIFFLTKKGKFLADRIAMELFYEAD